MDSEAQNMDEISAFMKAVMRCRIAKDKGTVIKAVSSIF